MIKKEVFVSVSRDRPFVILFLVVGLLSIITVVNIALRINVSDVQIPVRYSGFGFTNIFRGQWYTLLEFGLFALSICVVNALIVLKTYSSQRRLALAFLGLTLFLLVLNLIIANVVFNLSPLL